MLRAKATHFFIKQKKLFDQILVSLCHGSQNQSMVTPLSIFWSNTQKFDQQRQHDFTIRAKNHAFFDFILINHTYRVCLLINSTMIKRYVFRRHWCVPTILRQNICVWSKMIFSRIVILSQTTPLNANRIV